MSWTSCVVSVNRPHMGRTIPRDPDPDALALPAEHPQQRGRDGAASKPWCDTTARADGPPEGSSCRGQARDDGNSE